MLLTSSDHLYLLLLLLSRALVRLPSYFSCVAECIVSHQCSSNYLANSLFLFSFRLFLLQLFSPLSLARFSRDFFLSWYSCEFVYAWCSCWVYLAFFFSFCFALMLLYFLLDARLLLCVCCCCCWSFSCLCLNFYFFIRAGDFNFQFLWWKKKFSHSVFMFGCLTHAL